MKKIVLLAALIFLLPLWSPAAPAWAEQFTGGLGTVELPAGWTAHYEQDGIDIIKLTSPDHRCRVAIMLGPVLVADSKAGAGMLAQTMGGATVPEPVPGHEDAYRFYSEAQPSQRMEVTVFVRGMAMMGWAQSGATDEFAGDLKTIWNSLSSQAPKFQALFAALYKL